MRFLLKEEWKIDYAARDGIPPMKIKNFIEDIYNLIGKIVRSKGYPHEIYGISMTVFHYFSCFKNFKQIDPIEISVACVYLACKIQLTYIPIDKVHEIYDKEKSERDDSGSKKRPDFLRYEIELYTFLGFDLDIESPYLWYYKFIKTNKGKMIIDTAREPIVKNVLFNILNDTYRKPICLYYHPKIIMLAAMAFTIKFTNINITIETILEGEDIGLISECLDSIYEIYDEVNA